jgi:hypothetical protein
LIVLNYAVPGLAAARCIRIVDLLEDPVLRDDFMEKSRFRNRDLEIDTAAEPAQPRFDIVFILHHRHLYGLRRLPRLITNLFKGAKQAPGVVLYDCDISTNRIISLKRGQVMWFTCRVVVFNLVLLGLRLIKKFFHMFQGKKS